MKALFQRCGNAAGPVAGVEANVGDAALLDGCVDLNLRGVLNFEESVVVAGDVDFAQHTFPAHVTMNRQGVEKLV